MRHVMLPCAVAAMMLGTAVAKGDLGDQLFKLLPDDGAALDVFGESVAIDGTIAIVGAWGHGEYGGSAYLFDTTTGQQTAKLLPNDGEESDKFGFSVAISGTTAIVGARLDDDNGESSGSAYLFDTTTGDQLFKLLPNDGAAGDYFGNSVGISGTTAIVGAHLHDGNGESSGSAYLFDTTTGQQIAKLLADDGAQGDWFGVSVAIDGSTAIVGAYGDDDNGSGSGSAYLFNTATGQQIFKLRADDGAEFNLFGISVAISDTTAIVGANDFDHDGTSWFGSAYLFDTTTGQQIAKLLPDDGAGDDFFGLSVAISGTAAIVGAYGDDDNGADTGSAYLFDTTTGQQIAKLLPDDGAPFDWFGESVAISGTTVIAGALLDEDNGHDSGSAYVFDVSYCPSDFDGNGAVSALDLALLLGNWGPCPEPPDPCPTDLDGDGIVNAGDLAILLGSWGPCP